MPDTEKIIQNLSIKKDGEDVKITKIYENVDLTCNYEKDIHFTPTMFVDENDVVIDNDFTLST